MSEKTINILIAEDDENLSYLLKKNLTEEGYEVILAGDGLEAWDKFNENNIHLCILDVMMPKQDGFALAEMIRGKDQLVPVLFLTAKTMREDVYKGFESGGDDYITKPFTAKELIFRIRAIIKRTYHNTIAHTQNSSSFSIGNIVFDQALRRLIYADSSKNLSTKENELLRIFCEHRNRVVNRNRLLLEVWGRDDYFVSKSLDVYITRLRKLLREDPNITIQNYHSFGYKMVVKDMV